MLVKATQVGVGGALERAEPLISEEYVLTLLAEKALTCTPTGGTQATMYIVKSEVGIITQQAGAGVKFNVGDIITKKPAGADKAVVMEVSANADDNSITKIGLLVGSFEVGDFLDGAIDKQITDYGDEDSTFDYSSGLWIDPIFMFDDYENGAVAETHKIKIDTSNGYLQVDIVYYMDGTTETMREK